MTANELDVECSTALFCMGFVDGHENVRFLVIVCRK